MENSIVSSCGGREHFITARSEGPLDNAIVCMYFDERVDTSTEVGDGGPGVGEPDVGVGGEESSLERLGMALERCR